jgi:tetratricopeptide (TPR) repeat protein
MQIAMGDTKGALNRLRAAQPLLREIPEITSMLGSVALLAKDHKTAYAQFESLVRSAPENLEYRLGFATSLALLGQTERAKEEYRQVQEKAGNNPQPWLLYGSLLSSSGNRAAAIGAYKEAVQRDAKNPYALNNLAFLMAREGKDLKQALQFAEEARRVLPRSTEISDTLAYVYLLLDMRHNALATLEQLSTQGSGEFRERNLDLIARINRGDIRGARAEMERGSGSATDEGI